MASYVENFKSKLDWAMPFQRTGKFPLDRSSIFSSYADALAYARQDESDSRKLGGTSYVGQIIAIYGNDQVGTGTEVAAYIITSVGENAALMKLAQTTATGDFATDIARIDGSLSALGARITALENAEKVVDTNTTYTFQTAINTDGAIKYSASDGTEGEIQVKGWDTLVALATGRSKAYVYSNKTDAKYLTEAKQRDMYRVGDLIYFTDINLADEWVTRVLTEANADGFFYEFAALETEHPDLSGYLTSSDAELVYAKKTDLKASEDTINGKITNLQTAVSTKAEQSTVTTLQGEVDALEEALGKIDVSSQITAKINELDVAKVGGSNGSYITSIEQQDGKIVATASTLPDYDTNAQNKANKALENAKSYTEERLGDIGEKDVKTYVDDTAETINNTITQKDTAMDGRVKVLESAKTTMQGQINTNADNITQNTTAISGISGRVQTLEGTVSGLSTKVSNIETKLNGIEEGAQANRIEIIKVGGVALGIEDKTVNISAISTDLLTQGTQTLVLDCLNASLTKTE